MTQTKRSGPHRQERAAANALVEPQDSGWPPVKQPGTASTGYILELRRHLERSTAAPACGGDRR